MTTVFDVKTARYLSAATSGSAAVSTSRLLVTCAPQPPAPPPDVRRGYAAPLKLTKVWGCAPGPAFGP